MKWALLGVATHSLRWVGSLQGPTGAEPKVWHGGWHVPEGSREKPEIWKVCVFVVSILSHDVLTRSPSVNLGKLKVSLGEQAQRLSVNHTVDPQVPITE